MENEKKRIYFNVQVRIQELDPLGKDLCDEIFNDIENLINRYLDEKGLKRYEE